MRNEIDAIIFASKGCENIKEIKLYLEPLEKIIINTFTNIPCHRIFLDNAQRLAIYQNDNIFVDDLESSVNLLISKKVKNALIVPIMPGYSNLYDLLKRQTEEQNHKFQQLILCKPIFQKNLNDYEEKILEKQIYKSNEAKKNLITNVGEYIRGRKGV